MKLSGTWTQEERNEAVSIYAARIKMTLKGKGVEKECQELAERITFLAIGSESLLESMREKFNDLEKSNGTV